MPKPIKNKYQTYNLDRKKEYMCIIVMVAVIFAALAVGYYFFYALPNLRQQQLISAIIKQANEAALKKTELAEKKQMDNALLAKQIQDDCVKVAQAQITLEFSLTNLLPVPFYYPYKDAASFVKNERLLSANNAYRACLKNDVRNDGKNEYVKKLDDTALGAWTVIRNFMVQVKQENPDICKSKEFTPATKSLCVELVVRMYKVVVR